MLMKEDTEIVIVGAGGGGAVLGLALAQRGIPVMVLEQAPGPPTGLRGEILQPNGQRILDELGVLQKLPADAVRSVRLFHFLKAGGDRLCTIDYGMLPPPYNRAVVTMPNAAHHVILQELEQTAPRTLRYGTTFTRLLRQDGAVIGVEAEKDGARWTVHARLVVGADGPLSRVREAAGISSRMHRYSEGYLIALLDAPDASFTESRYYVGRRSILGLFPASDRKVYAFYMIPADSMPAMKAAGLAALRAQWTAIAPDLAPLFANLLDWKQTAYMPTGRVRAATWVLDGLALIGDAAHAMNPHASQGRMQAMMDAMTLADVIRTCREIGDWSAATLKMYERRRRPHVEMLQRV